MTGAPESPDVVEALADDHREIVSMLGEADAADGRLTGLLAATLVRHAVAEEEYVYPLVRDQAADGERVADRGMAQHAQIEETLQQLSAAGSASGPAARSRIRRLLAALAEDVRRHVRYDETELFPRLRRACTRSDLTRLGEYVVRLTPATTGRAEPAHYDELSLVEQVRTALAERGRTNGR